MSNTNAIPRLFLAATAAVFLFAACGDDDPVTVSEPVTENNTTEVNACPTDGCTIGIASVVADGDELTLTWDANYAPDIDRNHIHVFWDTFTADEVSSDAADRGVVQGEWVPTDASPTYTTEGAASTKVRGESTTLCVTAADGDHAVIDSSLVECRDVADLLEP